MYLSRKIDAFLKDWKARKKRKPLIIKGARQIGKTESIRHFAARHYSSVVEINFVDNGGLFENIVAEAIRKSGGDLYYYRREDSKLEEDFFLRSRSGIVPIEVKATGGRSKSLRTLVDSAHYPDISFGVKVANANVGLENGIYTVPHFCAFLLKDWLARHN